MILTYGNTSIDIGQAQYPHKQDTELIQVKERSASGVVYTEDFNVAIGTNTYSFVDMEQSVYEELISFFLDTVRGMLNEFEILDDLSITSTVKFTTSKIMFTKNAYNLWNGSFTVETV